MNSQLSSLKEEDQLQKQQITELKAALDQSILDAKGFLTFNFPKKKKKKKKKF